MSPNENRPGGTAPPRAVTKPARAAADGTASVDDAADNWRTIRAGWVRAGDAMPRRGSLAWLALGADDPVRQAAELAEDFGAAGDLKRHGPAVARALAEVAG
jgi:hypothetical protein